MKKSPTKLSLTKHTVRVLQAGELAAVNGGAPTNAATICAVANSLRCPVAFAVAVPGDEER